MEINNLAKMIEKYNKIEDIIPFEKGYSFYFDETNNCRKICLDSNKTNGINDLRALEHDFVLGGLCFCNEPDTHSLFDKLKLQPNAPELKSKHIWGDCSDFLNGLENPRITVLLEWLNNNDNLYIHYSTINNLYYALVDIVDGILKFYPQCIDFILQLKNSLYTTLFPYKSELLSLLSKFNYPNLKRTETNEFAKQLSLLISEANIEDDFYAEMLRQMLKSLPEKSELVSLYSNTDRVLLENYAGVYINRIATFLNSSLIFDKEPYIISNINIQIPKNVSFINSKDNKFIQISDCIVSIIAKTFKFLDNYNGSDFEITNIQMKNLGIIKQLLERSDKKSKLLLTNFNAVEIINSRYNTLKFITSN